MQKSRIDFSEKYVLCLTEGTAEREIMEMLLDDDMLLFKREDLVGKKIQRRMSVSAVEEKFLSLSYSKPVVIIRVIDSRKESFKLKKQFQGRFEIITISTHPEIELLLILHKGDYPDYCKTKSVEKPSSYCKRKYGYRKNQDVFSSYFSVEELIQAMRMYSQMIEEKEFSFIDLINL